MAADKLPIIVSSAREFCGVDYDNLQRLAITSWRDVASIRMMLNDSEEIESFGDAFYHPLVSPPTIKELIDVAIDNSDSIIAIVNSDIILTKDILKIFDVTKGGRLGRAWAATSFRWEKDGNKELGVIGQGLDCFIMTSHVAKYVLRDLPPFITIGRGMWDSWLCGWLRRNLAESRFFNMTPWKCVIHNIHERPPGRLSNYTEAQVKQIMSSGHLSCAGIPKTVYL